MFDNHSVTEQCHAKINLFLHITEKRPDDYHNLQSWIAFADAVDTITLREAKTPFFLTSGHFAQLVPPAQNNLITRTIELMAARHKKKKANFYVELTKNLPVGSGLGSGSANVAGTLRALQKLWGFSWGEDDAAWLAKNIGADVPVCLSGQTAMVSGLGERLHLTHALPPNCHIVLVFPNVGISTASVFAMIAPPYTPPMTIKTRCVNVIDLVESLKDTRNDLMQAAMSVERSVLKAYRALSAQPGCLLPRMSGSGTTCFGIFSDAETAKAATRAIAVAEPTWWVRTARLL